MKSILDKCETADFQYISGVLDSYLSLTDDKKRKRLLVDSQNDAVARTKLIEILDEQIRYYGSSDIAYLARSVLNGNGGISAIELIGDVCDKLKVTVKKGGSIEALLERVVKNVVEKELLSKTPEQLSKAFEDIGMGNADRDLVMENLKTNGKVAVLPLLVRVIGPKATLGIIETIIVSLIAQIIGKEAAKQLIGQVIKRNPWLNALGPIVWAASGAWLAHDLQGPAFRKTVPVVLYLGVVALRDGAEDLE